MHRGNVPIGNVPIGNVKTALNRKHWMSLITSRTKDDTNMLNAKLAVVGGDAKTAEINLNLPTIIGRGREVGLSLPHPLVSRQHCELFEREGRLVVRDLKSLNGTYLDNRRIDRTEVIKPDQLLTIGNVTFRAIYRVGDQVETETAARSPAETVFESSGASVIDIDEVAAADADSQIDGDQPDSIHSRPTQPGKPQQHDPAAVHPDAAAVDAQDGDDLAHGDHDAISDHHAPATAGPQHSVCAAMIDAGAAASPVDATLSELHGQLPQPGPLASNIHDVTARQNDPASSSAGDSFAGIEADDPEAQQVNPEESALGSFIRKLPR